METKTLEVFTEAVNSAIVRVPGRRFPGVVIQGDSLSILFNDAMTLVEELENSKDEEAFFTALLHAESLEEHLKNYEQVLKEHGIELPYFRNANRSTAKYSDRWKDCDV